MVGMLQFVIPTHFVKTVLLLLDRKLGASASAFFTGDSKPHLPLLNYGKCYCLLQHVVEKLYNGLG